MANATVLFVDDDENVREGLRLSLRTADYDLRFAGGAEDALEQLRREPIDIVVSDHAMPGVTGLEFLKLVQLRHPETVRIMLTGHADLSVAIDAINHGEIYRFLTKPCDPVELRVTLHLARERLELERENRRMLTLIRTSPELVAQLERLGAKRAATSLR